MEEKLQKVIDAFNETKDWVVYTVDGTLGAAFGKGAVRMNLEANKIMIYTDGLQELSTLNAYVENGNMPVLKISSVCSVRIVNANYVALIDDRLFTRTKDVSMYVDWDFAYENIRYIMDQHKRIQHLLGETFTNNSLTIFKGGELKNVEKEE